MVFLVLLLKQRNLFECRTRQQPTLNNLKYLVQTHTVLITQTSTANLSIPVYVCESITRSRSRLVKMFVFNQFAFPPFFRLFRPQPGATTQD